MKICIVLSVFLSFQILSRGYVIPDSENNEFSDTKYFVTERDVQNRAAVDTLPTIELITNEGGTSQDALISEQQTTVRLTSTTTPTITSTTTSTVKSTTKITTTSSMTTVRDNNTTVSSLTTTSIIKNTTREIPIFTNPPGPTNHAWEVVGGIAGGLAGLALITLFVGIFMCQNFSKNQIQSRLRKHSTN